MFTSNGAEAQPADRFASVVTDERRTDERHPRKFAMKLSPVGGATSLECICENVSEGGCFTNLPTDAGFSVGQRCELEFASADGQRSADNLAGEVCYATVVRTETVAHAAGPSVGTGLRFDQPLFL